MFHVEHQKSGDRAGASRREALQRFFSPCPDPKVEPTVWGEAYGAVFPEIDRSKVFHVEHRS
jgi:hypothetical protein